MNKNIDLNKVKEYADNIVNMYPQADPAAFTAWFKDQGYAEAQDSTEELLAEGLVAYYIDSMADDDEFYA